MPRKKDRPPKGQTSEPARVRLLLQFLKLGFVDYIGARALLRLGLPLQGAVLGSTAVEKYFKAIAAVRGNQLKGHLKKSHLNLVQNFVPELFQKFNPAFLDFLGHCYHLRYTDALPSDFNVVVYARETLAELDFTVFHCEFQLNLTRSDGLPVRTAYREALQKKDARLLEDNFLLQQVEKGDFLKEPDTAYGIRNRPKEGILEVEFTVFESPKDGDFTREAVRPVSQEELNAMLKEAEEK